MLPPACLQAAPLLEARCRGAMPSLNASPSPRSGGRRETGRRICTGKGESCPEPGGCCETVPGTGRWFWGPTTLPDGCKRVLAVPAVTPLPLDLFVSSFLLSPHRCPPGVPCATSRCHHPCLCPPRQPSGQQEAASPAQVSGVRDPCFALILHPCFIAALGV